MPTLLAHDALLPTGWARDVLLEWDDDGRFTRVARVTSKDAPAAAGPVLAGMSNVHSHAFQRAMAGLAERRGHPTDDFWTWREEMYALVERLSPEDVEAIAEYVYIELLRNGYTAVGEFHYVHRDLDGKPYANRAEMAERIVAAAQSTGIALTLLPVVYAYGGFGSKPLGKAQGRFACDASFAAALLHDLQRHARGDARMRLGIAPHSVRAVDAAMLQETVRAARALDPRMPVHMHVSEQTREVDECRAAHGKTPLEWIREVVEIDAHWCLIHATHLTHEERQAAAAAQAVVGLCPTTEANLGDGIFDFDAWFARRAPWGIGGDSHVSVSPFEELRALEESQRLRIRVRNVAASAGEPDVPANLWRGAAHGGARALGQPAGVLEAGSRADFIVLDRGDARFEGLEADRLLGAAMFGGSSVRVRDVFVAGRAVVQEGHHARDAQARAAFRAALRRLRS